jgi:hypothetical protein
MQCRYTLITIGGRVADAPFRRRVAAVNTDKREADLAMMGDAHMQGTKEGREETTVRSSIKVNVEVEGEGDGEVVGVENEWCQD